VVPHRVAPADVYTARSLIVPNGYDRRLAAGISLDTSLSNYITSMLPRAGSSYSAGSGRSKSCLRKLLRLHNGHGVTPLLVLMPYHPTALSAFREVGWQHKLDAAKRYLARLSRRHDFRLFDYTEISSFDGDAGAFYDGAHVTKRNADLILALGARQAPAYFE
jgi:hypothetical protein